MVTEVNEQQSYRVVMKLNENFYIYIHIYFFMTLQIVCIGIKNWPIKNRHSLVSFLL